MDIAKVITTFFGIGYFPIAPGTAATVAGMGLAFVLQGSPWAYTLITVLLMAIGIPFCTKVEKMVGTRDPGIIVLDEVIGVLVAMVGLPMIWPVVISVFFLFRAFDMFKIYPINRFEAKPGGWGIMLDDVMAGLYTNLILQIAIRWSGVI